MKKQIKVCVILLAALCVELFYFNFNYFFTRFMLDIPHNVQLNIDDFEMWNWEKTEEGYVSEPDPILACAGVNMFVEKILVEAELDWALPYVVFFYTDDSHAEFSEETMIKVSQTVNGTVEIPVSRYVKDIRIDLGDDAGIKLTGLSATMNPMHFDFSFARYITMLVVCFGFWGLTSLQRSPEYGLGIKKAGSVRKDEKDG